jgi:hypothetical protein
MTYLEARRAVRDFEAFRDLTMEYWAALEPIDYHGQAWMAGRAAPTQSETETSSALRTKITMMLPQVQT